MVDKGSDITYVAGNHDYWMGDFLTKEVGLKTVRDALETTIDGRRFFISHGDGLATTGQTSYRALKAVLHSRAVTSGFRVLHPDLGLRLAAAFSKMSRRRSSRNSRLDPGLEAFVGKKAGEGFDFLVLGHLHQPLLFKVGGTTCLVAGDWIDNLSYGIYADGNLKLERWEAPEPASDSLQETARSGRR